MVLRYLSNRRPMEQLREEMNRLVSNFMGGLESPWFLPSRGQPAMNVWDAGQAIMVEMEVPGVKSHEIEISVVENELTVKVERAETAAEGTTYHRRERTAGSFSRVVRLPVPVVGDQVSADLQDGVLTITLPKTAAAKPRKISVATK